IDPFLAAQLSNAVLATQAFQHDADLLFSGMMPACGSANILDCLFSALRYALALFTAAPQRGYDGPAILSYAISSFCPTSADGLQGDVPLAMSRGCVRLASKNYGRLLSHAEPNYSGCCATFGPGGSLKGSRTFLANGRTNTSPSLHATASPDPST